MYKVAHCERQEFDSGMEATTQGVFATLEEAGDFVKQSGIECRINRYTLTPNEAAPVACAQFMRYHVEFAIMYNACL